MAKVKITVVKKTDAKELFGDNPPVPYRVDSVCKAFEVGQEFESNRNCPEGFCNWAFADIQRDIIGVANGANFKWLGQAGVAISCCTDGIRPVIFKIERMEETTA